MLISTREAFLGQRQIKKYDTSSKWMTLLKWGSGEWTSEARSAYPKVFNEKRNRANFYDINQDMKSFVLYDDGHVGNNDSYTMTTFSPGSTWGVYYNPGTNKLLMAVTGKVMDEQFLQAAFDQLDNT